LITGQNPQSARSTAESVVEEMEKTRSVRLVLTAHDKLGETKGDQTGWYLPEAAHPYYVFKNAGVRMTFASPKGGEAPVDVGSVDMYKKDKESADFYNKAEEKAVWQHTTKLSDIDPAAFDAVFVVGGYGVMWDLVGNDDMERIAAHIYDHGGVVSAVCHGPAALVGVKLGDGTPLVKDKEVACFSNAEEDVMKRRGVVPKTCQDSYKAAGAKYTKGDPWSDHVAASGRLITGQNPMSAKSTAEAVVKLFEAEDKKDDKATEEKFASLPNDVLPRPAISFAAVGMFAGGAALVAFGLAGTRAARTYVGTPADQELLIRSPC